VMLPSVAVPGYPRELEAIILTAMANDPNARFQSGQEMIEALDAFTVRAKLTGSNTAMGRFMVQLFGSRSEPWVEGADVAPERTQVTEPNHEHQGPGNEEKTAILDDRDRPRSGMLQPQPVAHVPVRQPSPELSASADVAAWQEPDARQPQRGVSPRPSAPPFDVPTGRTSSRDLMKTTLAGVTAPPRPSSPSVPPFAGRLGSEPPAAPAQHRPRAAPAYAEQTTDVKIRSYWPWIVLAVLMALGVLTGVAIAMSLSN